MFSTRFDNQYPAAFSENWGKFLVWGIALVILGLIAIGATTMTTVVSIMFFGFLLLLGGIVMVVDAFSFWWNKWGSFFLLLLLGVLYFAVGMMLMQSPMLVSISLTLFLGIFYIVIGLFRIIYFMSIRIPSRTWGLLGGILSLLLGVLILASWPQSGLYIIGLFIGIDLFFTSWAYIMASLAARSLV